MSGHVKANCWRLYLELKSKSQKNNQGRNDIKVTLIIQKAKNLLELKQSDVMISLMMKPKGD